MTSKLDFQQIIKKVFNEEEGALEVTGISGGGVSSNVTIDDITTTTPMPVTEDFTVQASVDTLAASINDSAGAFTQVVASLASDCTQIAPYETTGKKIGVYTGAAASEVLLFIIGPGQDTPVRVDLPAGTRISIRSTEAVAPSSGSLILTFSRRS